MKKVSLVSAEKPSWHEHALRAPLEHSMDVNSSVFPQA